MEIGCGNVPLCSWSTATQWDTVPVQQCPDASGWRDGVTQTNTRGASTRSAASILVAEDDGANRALCESLLTDAGYSVTVAHSCLQAKQYLARTPFDLVLLDIGLPDGNGLGLLHNRSNDVPVVVMTVQGDPEQRAEGLRKGATDYLVKPFHPEELLWRVARAMASPVPEGVIHDIIQWCGYRLDCPGRLFKSPTGNTVTLTEGEAKILALLIQFSSAVSIDLLADAITSGVGNSRSVAVLITRLRRKFDDTEGFTDIEIRPVHGFGYVIEIHTTP